MGSDVPRRSQTASEGSDRYVGLAVSAVRVNFSGGHCRAHTAEGAGPVATCLGDVSRRLFGRRGSRGWLRGRPGAPMTQAVPMAMPSAVAAAARIAASLEVSQLRQGRDPSALTAATPLAPRRGLRGPVTDPPSTCGGLGMYLVPMLAGGQISRSLAHYGQRLALSRVRLPGLNSRRRPLCLERRAGITQLAGSLDGGSRRRGDRPRIPTLLHSYNADIDLPQTVGRMPRDSTKAVSQEVTVGCRHS